MTYISEHPGIVLHRLILAHYHEPIVDGPYHRPIFLHLMEICGVSRRVKISTTRHDVWMYTDDWDMPFRYTVLLFERIYNRLPQIAFWNGEIQLSKLPDNPGF